MSYLSSIHINTQRKHPYPYDVPAIKFAKNIDVSNQITFIIGENGTGKSTLLESLACRLQLPHMDGFGYDKKCFDAAKKILPHLELNWNMERSVGFFFRAEDFGDYLNSVHRNDINLYNQIGDLGDDVPNHILQQMKDSANEQLHRVRKNYGQELDTFSHGEAYMHIMNAQVNRRGIYILDEPEASLSPAKQLAFIYFIQNHLQNFNSQFIIATHSPMLMAYPTATIYEVTNDEMKKTALEDTDHYMITKSFLNNPDAYLRHF
ncbi:MULTISPECIES: AAA family ATPase [unclassified Polaribacter]|uniref:AAA family ATPase n=1 Tax=unclassified Polaribacter TaxID=196858 RepID=UPI0011BE3792|nr:MULTISPECIES: AAA family ATPase [unclassified Polaribacter]TXD51053.1 AAA family ATPase [Polaribacter sp. IC063]TXD57934.1 AAA family ATPase [Polaribacter sp. IC066]